MVEALVYGAGVTHYIILYCKVHLLLGSPTLFIQNNMNNNKQSGAATPGITVSIAAVEFNLQLSLHPARPCGLRCILRNNNVPGLIPARGLCHMSSPPLSCVSCLCLYEKTFQNKRMNRALCSHHVLYHNAVNKGNGGAALSCKKSKQIVYGVKQLYEGARKQKLTTGPF